MDSEDSPDRLNWKICFKKILAPHLVNLSIDDKPNNELEAHMVPDPKNVNLNISKPPEKPGIPPKDISLGIEKEPVKTDVNNRQFFNGFQDTVYNCPDEMLYNFENSEDEEKNIASIISADAEELSKSLKALKVSKKNKKFCKTKRNRIVPDWNTAFRNILNPTTAADTTLDSPTLKMGQSQMIDSSFIYPWIFHKLSTEGCQESRNIEFPQQSQSKKVNARPYTEAEKNALKKLRLARSFKQREKPHVNFFDGAGVNCFKN